MSQSTGDRAQWRDRTRIAPKGSVLLRLAEVAQHGRLGNIGEGGMFVFTDVSTLGSWQDCAIDFELRFDGAGAAWVRGAGRVVRVQAPGLSVAFEGSSSALLQSLGELVTASHLHARVMAVVLIDADAQRRARTAAGFRATGCAVEEVATPLEAISLLGAASFEPDVIAVADSKPSAAADDMRAFVEHAHPDALLLTIGDEIVAPSGMAHWLSSADPEADLPARVREILVRHVLGRDRD